MRPVLTAAMVIVLSACSGGEKDDVVDTDTDTDGVPADSDIEDTGTDDTEPPVETEPPDPCEGALEGVGDSADTDACVDFPIEEVLVTCEDVLTYAVHIGDPLTAGCETWWDVGGVAHPELENALECAGCDRTCVYRPSRSVMLLYCGFRGEYIEWEPGAPGQVGDGADCEPLLEFQTAVGGGFFPSREAFEAAYPCPEDTDTDSDSDTDTDSDSDTDTDSDSDTDTDSDSDTDTDSDSETDTDSDSDTTP